MKICFFSSMYNLGGGERNLLDISNVLKEKAHTVVVYVPRNGQLAEKLHENDIKYCFYNGGRYNRRWFMGIPFFDVLGFYKIIKWNKKNKFIPEVVHTNSIDSIPLAYLVAKYYNIKLLWTCHGPWEIPKYYKNVFINIFVDKIIAISPEIFNMLNCEKKILIPLGIDDMPSKLYSTNKKSRTYKIVCVARFQHIKGQDLLIRAFVKIKEKVENIELHFYGGFLSENKSEKDFYEDNLKLVYELKIENYVFFHGYDSNIRERMGEYDLLCIPSRYESFSLTLLEGLNRGMNIVAPNIGGPQYIIENGKSGILFEIGNSEDLAIKCISILKKQIVLNQKAIIDRGKVFTANQQVNQLISLYKDLVN